MYSNKNKLEYKYSAVVLPVLLTMLVFGLFTFLIDSFNVVSETNKNNFFYTTKIRNSIDEIDKIIERADINLDGASYVISQTYDISKLNDAKYNKLYLKHIDVLIKTILANTPEIDGSWFQLNIDSPQHQTAYLWYQLRDNKIINLRHILDEEDDEQSNTREINPEDDPYYFEAVKNRATTWSDIYIDADIKKEMITISKPIYTHNKLIGVLGVDITIQNLKQALINMKAEFPNSEIYLLDSNKNILVNIKQDGSSEVSDVSFFKNKFLASEKSEDMTEYREGWVDKTAIKLPLSNKYNVVIAFPNAIIYKGFSRLFKTLYFVFAVLLLLLATVLLNSDRIKKMNRRIQDESMKLKTILDASPNRITMADTDGVMVYANIKFLTAFNFTIDDLRGKKLDSIFRPEIVPNIQKGLRLAKETLQVQTFESSYLDPKEGELYFTNYIIPIADSKGTLTGYVGLAMDITKEVREKELLKHAKDVAERATTMKSNFLANMSHEIRTPLNGVLGFIQLLKDTKLSEEQEEFVNDAQKSSEILLDLINDILDFSKIEADKLKIDNISFDVRSVIEDVVLSAVPTTEAKGTEINALICSDVPQRVYGDPGRIKQILNNLVGNAIKFTPKGEIVVYAKNVSETDDKVKINFEVKDSGIGIDKEKLGMIFEAFTQADSSTTRKFGGTGLGLAISQKLVNLMNGEIKVDSIEGEGSTFSFCIEFAKDNDVKFDTEPSADRLSGKSVVLFDTNNTDVKILKYYLSEVNCNVSVVANIDELMSTLECNKEISTILVDHANQNVDGVDLISLVSQNAAYKHIPMILLTSVAKKGDSTLAKGKGYCGYLTKPIKKNELIKTIALVIDPENSEEIRQLVTKHLVKEVEFMHRAKILVVEDCEINCKLILKILANQGLVADVANDGLEALQAYKSKKYDLILMDCQMPVMSGYEATKAIREIEVAKNIKSPIPIIALTANAFLSDQQKCFEAGMTDYVSKPVKIEALLDKINHYILITHDDETNRVETDDILNQMTKELEFSKQEAIDMFIEYLEFLPSAIQDARSALERDDYEHLKEIAHKIKGSSANLRIESVTNLSIMIEECAIRQDKDACASWINSLSCDFDYFNTVLQNFV